MVRRTTWILLGVLGLTAIGYAVLARSGGAGQPAATTTPTERVWDLAAESIESIRLIEVATGRMVVLSRDETAGWRMLAPRIGAADTGRVEMNMASLLAPTVRQKAEAGGELDSFGLEPPGFRLTLFLGDGTAPSLEVGNLDPTGSVYYTRRPPSSTVLMVPRFALEDVLGMIGDPPYPPATPTPEAAAATGTP